MNDSNYTYPFFLPALVPKNTSIVAMPSRMAEKYAWQSVCEGKNVILAGRDEISLESEKAIKNLASEKNLWVMTPHAFAHEFRRGPVGIVGTAGTAVQHVGCLLEEVGIGVASVYSLGSRDLLEEVGGRQTFDALELLSDRVDIDVIVVLIKPISRNMERKLIEVLKSLSKPSIMYTVGKPTRSFVRSISNAKSLREIPNLVASLLTHSSRNEQTRGDSPAHGYGYIRGVFSGGSCCDEAVGVLQSLGLRIHSNSPVCSNQASTAKGHSCVDLGAGINNQGRIHYPNPMINLDLKLDRLTKEASDPHCSVVLFDVFLGYGSHANPSPKLVSAISTIRQKRSRHKLAIEFIAAVIGTPKDPQRLFYQRESLSSANVLVTSSITEAALIAYYCISVRRGKTLSEIN